MKRSDESFEAPIQMASCVHPRRPRQAQWDAVPQMYRQD